MGELKNYAEFKFSNPILIDIFGHYMENSVLAAFVSESGEINLKLEIKTPVKAPKNCEDVLGILFMILEDNPTLPIGQAYTENKTDIMRETIFRLSQILDGFNNVKIVLHTTQASEENPEDETSTHTEFTLNRTKNTNQ